MSVPKNPSLMQMRATARRLAAEDVEQALAYLDGLPEPGADDALIIRLDLLSRLDRREEARDIAVGLAERHRDRPEVQGSAADALVTLRFHQDAAEPAWRYVQLCPGDLDALRTMSVILQHGAGEEHREEFLQLLGDLATRDASAAVEYGFYLQNVGLLDACWEYDLQSVKRFPKDFRLWARRAATAIYRDDLGPAELLRYYKDFGRQIESSVRPAALGFRNVPDPNRRIRLGFLSNDFYLHVIADFAYHMIEALDRTQFEVFLYSTSDRSDIQTDRYKKVADTWRDLSHQRPDLIVRRIVEDEVDVLIDLSGLTMGALAGVLAYRPAPIQITYLGSPATTGMSRVQYRLVDEVSDPDSLEPATTEELLKLPRCFLCYSPIREFDPPKGKSEGPVTFGCLGNTLKISRSNIAMWARILDVVPESRLLLLYRMLRVAGAREKLLQVMADAGMDLARVELRPGADGLTFQRMYDEIDVSLDTFPYSGTTTTCESLSKGVPMVTLAGDMHRSRVSASILRHSGFGAWVAETPDEYVSIAQGLAKAPPRTEYERVKISEQFLGSSVCDVGAFVPAFGDAVRSVWAKWCASPV